MSRYIKRQSDITSTINRTKEQDDEIGKLKSEVEELKKLLKEKNK